MTPRINTKGYFYSKISSAQDCLRKYRYQYVDEVQPEAVPSGDLEFGSALHAGLGAYLTGSDGLAVFNIYWSNINKDEISWGRFDYASLKSKGELFLRRFEKTHLKKFKPHVVEQRMYADIDGIALEGTGDVIGEFDGVPTVLDFKTSKSPYHKNMIECNPQLYIYAKLAKESLGYDIKQIAYMVFCKQEERIQTLTFELTNTKLNAMIDNVVVQCKKLEVEKEFPMNTSSCIKGTFVCPYYRTCFQGGNNGAN